MPTGEPAASWITAAWTAAGSVVGIVVGGVAAHMGFTRHSRTAIEDIRQWVASQLEVLGRRMSRTEEIVEEVRRESVREEGESKLLRQRIEQCERTLRDIAARYDGTATRQAEAADAQKDAARQLEKLVAKLNQERG